MVGMSVDVTSSDGVAIVALNWPDRRNAIGPVQAQELTAALEAVGHDRDVSVVVLTGTGAFCAGGDLPAIAELAGEGPEAVRHALYSVFHALIRSVVDLPVPVLAAIDGPAVGLGMDLALATDWRVIGREGWLRQGWGELAVIPGIGGELLLRRLAPTLLWSLLSEPRKIAAGEAVRLGIADHSADDARSAAQAHAAALAKVPRETLEGYVRLHRAQLRADLDDHLELCVELQSALLCSDEFQRRAERALAPRA
jgi:enoyl-CoA hydratase/carnithine racemase